MTDRPTEDPPGRLRPTSAAALAVAALIGGLAGGLVPPLVQRTGGIVPTVSWANVFALAFWAAVLVALAVSTFRTVHASRQRDRARMDSQRAVNLLVLGKASALAGAVVAGGYLAFGLTFASQADVALPRERLVHGLAAAATGVAVLAGGLLLERSCRVPGDDNPDQESGERDA